jgi:hypothetical protein
MPYKRKVYRGMANPYKKARTSGRTRTAGFYGRYQPMGGEQKFLDTTYAQTGQVSSGTITYPSVNLIAQGAGESERIGRKVTLKSLLLRYVCVLNNTTSPGSTEDVVRVIVFLDKQCNGQAATVTDILETANHLSFNNLANKNRFSILCDQSSDLNSNGAIAAGFGEVVHTRSKYLRLNHAVEFSGATGAITEIRSNNIGILVITKGNNSLWNATVRIRYSDA